jgi:hypothetical protein
MCHTGRRRCGWCGTSGGGVAESGGCPRRSFTESLPAVPAWALATTRLPKEWRAGVAGWFACVKAHTEQYGVRSWSVAHAAFDAHVNLRKMWTR